MSLAQFQALAQRLAADPGDILGVDDLDVAVAAAVVRYSADRPRLDVEDLTATDGGLGLPAGWAVGFSEVRSLEFPIGRRPPVFLPLTGWYMQLQPAGGWAIELVEPVAENAVFRCTYTLPQVLDGETDTLPAYDREAVCCWAAALLCEQLAAAYSANTQPTIRADSVDQQSQARNYALRADKLRQRYFDALGVNPKKTVAAGVDVSFAGHNSLGGQRLTHPLSGQRWR